MTAENCANAGWHRRAATSVRWLAAFGLVALAAVARVAAADVVTAFPTTNAAVTNGGWTNPGSAYADDTAYATAAPARNQTVSSNFGGFGFDGSIPAGSTINSVTVTTGASQNAANANGTFRSQVWVGGVAQGSEWTTTALTTAIVSRTYTVPGLTQADLLNANFLVRVGFTRSGATTLTASLDFVSVTVDFTPPAPTTTLGDGTDPTAAPTLAPGGPSTALDAFTLQTSTGTDTATSVTVTLAPAGAFANVGAVTLTDAAGGTTYATVANPASNTVTFAGANLPVTTTQTQFVVRVQPRTHAAMPAVPGASYATTGTVTSFVSTNTQAGADVDSDTVTIDNLSPGAPSALAGTASDGQVALSWTNPSDADFTTGGQVLVLRRAGAAVADVPAEGTAYAVGAAVGSATVACVVTPPASSCAATGLANGTAYHFRAFARDARGNFSLAGNDAGPYTPQAATPTLTIGDATAGEAATTLAPGDPEVVLDAFTLTASSGTAAPSSVTVTLPAGSAALVETLTIEGTSACNQATPYGTATNPGSDAPAIPISGLSVGTSASALWVCVKPKTHPNMPAPPGTQVAVTGRVTAVVATGYAQAGSDAAGAARTIDNLSPADATWGANAAGDSQVSLAWTNPADADFADVLVLRSASSPITAAPTEGLTYAAGATIGAASVRYAGSLASFTDSAPNGTAWTYRIFSRDQRGNYAAGVESGPYTPAGTFVAEGDTTPNSPRPSVAIVNPAGGAVVRSPFKVQARVFSPGAAPVAAVTLSYGAATVAMARNASYGGGADQGIWEAQLPALAAGAYALRVQATNASGSVYSRAVDVTVLDPAPGAVAGDGNLLVRDNASQLCSDCHAHKSHGSEATGNAYGSWALACRDCHTPHGTTNIGLVRTEITPPSLTQQESPRTVSYLSRTGVANASGTGVCQVCHTRTANYNRNTPADVSHETGADCTTCHKHVEGLKAVCTDCHGTPGRVASVSGADSNLAAAPPALATPAATGAVDTGPTGGPHLAHLDRATYRAAPLACAACHATNLHQDGAADVAWGALATSVDPAHGAYAVTPASGAVAAAGWPTTPTCTNWCHGSGLAGGGRGLTWSWTGTGPLACNSCHGQAAVTAGTPPVAGAHHPQNTTCATCHGAGYASPIAGAARATHVDGTVQHPSGCTACHGKLTGTSGATVASGDAQAAPGYDALSVDTHGSTDRAQLGVGAHGEHVNAGLMSAKDCAVCHGTTPSDGDLLHANGTVAIGWSAPANAGGVTAAYAAPTCTSYCHSTGRPLGGTATTTAVAWTGTTPMTCTSCHATLALATNGHGMHVGTYGIDGCQTCHAGTALGATAVVVGGGAHVSGTNDVAFDGADSYVAGGSYAAAACSNTYCHSDGRDRVAPFTSGPSIAWTATRTCSSCHAAGTALASGSHGAHVNQASLYGRNYGCEACHSGTTADGATIASTALHVNMAADVTTAGVTYASSSCATYCHSSGQGGAATPQTYAGTFTWGTPLANDCEQCHGRYTPADFTSLAGEPNYASGGAGSATANSHRKHVAAATDCATCHATTANAAGTGIVAGTTHTDGSRQVAFDAARAGASASYAAGGATPKQCSNVDCHGGNPVQWGGAVSCSSCHARTTVAGGDLDNWSTGDGIASRIDSTEFAAVGHGQTSAAFSELAGATDRCLYCHDGSVLHATAGNPFRLRGAANAAGATGAYSTATELAVVAACLNCHSTGNGVDPDGAGGQPLASATLKIDALHHGARHGATNDGGQRCWDCHDPHGDGSNLAMVGRDTLRDAGDVHGLTGTRSTSPAVLAVRGAGGYTDATAAGGYNGVCQVCHTSTLYWRADGTAQGHNAGTDCVGCHAHQQPPDLAFQGAGACSACHLAPSGPGDQDLDDYAYNNGTKAMLDADDWAAYGHGATAAFAQSGNPAPAFPVTQTVEGCYYCHAPDTAIAGGNGDTSAHGDAADPFRLTNTGGADGKNGVCLVCHRTGSAGFDPDGAGAVFTSARSATSKIGAAHWGAKHSATGDGGAFCWDCHDPHGDFAYTTGNRALAFMIQELPTRDHSGPTGWGVPTALAGAVDFNAAVGGNTSAIDGPDYTDASATGGYAGVCQVCHTATTQHLASGANNAHQTGARCTACHAHDQGAGDAFRQATACNACHSDVPNASGEHAFHVGAATPAYGDVTPRATAGAYAYGCGKCHGTAATNHVNDLGGTAADPYQVNVAFDWTSGATPYTPGTASTDTGPTGLVFRTTTGTCATYCHSNGAPVGGTTVYAAPAWNAAGTTTCTSCHGSATVGTATMSSRHARHVQPVASSGYAYACNVCHAATVSSSATLSDRSNHVDGQNDVSFSAPATGTYDGGTFTCASVYCHSNGGPLGGTTTYVAGLRWDTGTVNATCTSCHGGDASSGASLATNKHPQHVDQAAVLGTNYGCVDCHATVASANRTVSDRTLHVNGSKQVSFPARGGQTSGAYASPTCASSYCHSNGRDPAATDASRYASVAWNQAGALGCNGCHGRGTAASGAPDYADGATLAEANSHPQHTSLLADRTSCQRCHGGLVSADGTAVVGSSHTDGVRNVVIAAAYDTNGATGNYDPATKTCSGVSCHGSGTPVWGTTLGCSSCHGTSPRTPVAGADANLVAAPPVGLAGETATTTRAVGAHLAHVNQITLRSAAIACAECHSGATHDGVKEVAFGTLATTGGRTPAWNGTTCASTYCHAPGGAEVGGSNRTPTWTSGPSQATCGTCHAAPPPVDATIADHPQNASCAACHGAGYATSGIASPAATTHLNASTAGGTDKPSNGCTACHGVLAGVAGASVPNTSMTAAPGYVGATTGVDTSGASAATVPSVGAHDAHVRPAGSLNSVAALDCAACHGPKPASLDTSHANGTVAAGWSSPANAGGVTPTPASFSAAWEATPNCTNYCHSNAAPLGGTNATPAFLWTSTSNLTCSSCHATSAFGTTNLSLRHQKHLTGYAYGCDECHATTMQNDSSTVVGTPANHVNGTKNVAFSSTLLSTTVNQSAGSYSGSPGYTCASTYCHSGGVATAPPFSATASAAVGWSAGTSTCRSCHGWDAAAAPTIGVAAGSSFQGSAAHAAHVANAAVIGTNYPCGDCHATVVAAGTNSPVTAPTAHVNGVKNVSIANRGTFASTDTTATCSATYCHSSGRDPNAGTPAYTTVTWTGAAIGCNGCHGKTVATGAPDYADGATLATANSHASHVSSAADCQSCHSGIVTAAGTAIASGSTAHTNGVRNVVILAAYDSNGATANYDPATKRCSGVTCHGSGTPVWGDATTATCTTCHGGAADVNNWSISDGTPSVINTGAEWTTYGHGSAAVGFAGANVCLYCHDDGVAHEVGTNPFRLRGVSVSGGTTGAFNAATNNGNGVCWNCHGTGSFGVDPDGGGGAYALRNGTRKIDAYHYGADHTATQNGGARCWDCHDAHGDATNRAMIGSDTLRASADAYGLAGTRSTTAAVLTTQGAGGYANTTTRNGICQVCHTTTAYWRSASEPAAHNVGSDCMSCHAHQQTTVNVAFAGKGGGPNCYGCHFDGEGGTRALSADFTKQSHHVRTNVGAFSTTGTTEAAGWGTNRDCVVCHSEGQIITAYSADCTSGTLPMVCTNPSYHANGTIDLRDVDTAAPARDGSGATFTYDKAAIAASGGSWNSANPVWATQTSTALDPFCLNCHDSGGAAQIGTFRISTETGRTALDPFWDGTANITNTYDALSRGRVVDIKSKVSGAPPAQGTFSRHAIRGQSTSRYTGATNYIANAGRFVGTWNDKSVMGCADCHTTDGGNGTNGNAHGSGSEYLLKDASGGAAEGSYGGANEVCAQCHAHGSYGAGHTGGNASDFVDTVTSTGAARVGSRADGTIFGLACMNCHGGAQGDGTGAGDDNPFGWIHGSSQRFVNGAGGTRSAYRFMNGSSLRYYSPGAAAGDTGWGGTTASCYTLSTGDSWGSCTQHGGGKATSGITARPLNY